MRPVARINPKPPARPTRPISSPLQFPSLPPLLEPDYFAPHPAWFLERVPGLEVEGERDEVVARLAPLRLAQLAATGHPARPLVLAQQTHGVELALVRQGDPLPEQPIPGVDGLLTDRRDLWLGILVADCAAVYLWDTAGPSFGLLHSGKKGTAQGILPAAVKRFHSQWGVPAGRLRMWISPCIRPPHYEVDFAAEILEQAHRAGVGDMRDSGICTACDPERFYSYRREAGRTGRMLAVLG